MDAQLRGMERIIDRVGYCGQWVKSVDICQCAPGSAFEIGRLTCPLQLEETLSNLWFFLEKKPIEFDSRTLVSNC